MQCESCPLMSRENSATSKPAFLSSSFQSLTPSSVNIALKFSRRRRYCRKTCGCSVMCRSTMVKKIVRSLLVTDMMSATPPPAGDQALSQSMLYAGSENLKSVALQSTLHSKALAGGAHKMTSAASAAIDTIFIRLPQRPLRPSPICSGRAVAFDDGVAHHQQWRSLYPWSTRLSLVATNHQLLQIASADDRQRRRLVHCRSLVIRKTHHAAP